MKEAVYNRVRAVQSLAMVARDADDTFEGATVDRGQFKNFARSASVLVYAGVLADGTHTITLEESDDGETFATATALLGSAPVITTANDAGIHEFGYTGNARYLRVVSTTTATTDGGVYGAVILLGDARREPIARS